jgi:protein-serine/threonine kinase
MTFGGSPWNAANKESEHYVKYKAAWDEWLQTHPDSQITDAPDGAPKAGKLWNKLDNPALKRLMLKMLNPDPEKRITIKDVVNSNIVKSTECCTPEDFEDPKHEIDTSCRSGLKAKSKMRVQKKHNHVPPKEQPRAYKLLKHRFDMGDGWS